MNTSEKLCLRWNDFERNISVAFREIREEKDFFDCTLSCGSKQIQAHKLILSACSPFFRSIFMQNPHQHPLLYLKGVEITDLQSVLNFMYHGEVNVAQEELNSFLTVAEDLQVKGLTQTNYDSINQKPTSDDKILPDSLNTSIEQEQSPEQLTHREAPQTHIKKTVIEGVTLVKSEPESLADSYSEGAMVTQDGVNGEKTMVEGFGNEVGFEYEGYEEGQYEGDQGLRINSGTHNDLASNNVVEDSRGRVSCGLCGNGFGYEKGNCKRHIRNVHSKTIYSFTCELCKKSYKNYDTLRSHQRAYHVEYQQ